jgi:hypothetical protein
VLVGPEALGLLPTVRVEFAITRYVEAHGAVSLSLSFDSRVSNDVGEYGGYGGPVYVSRGMLTVTRHRSE